MSSVLLRSHRWRLFFKAPTIHVKMSVWTVKHWMVTKTNNHFREGKLEIIKKE